jgi:hypothetical protein
MPTLQKFVNQTDFLWYHAEITDEQAAEYEAWENDETGELEEPDWLWDLDYDLVRDKPGSDDSTFEILKSE